MNSFFSIGVTHIGDGGKGKLQGQRREGLREVLLLLLRVEFILMGWARVLRDDLVHDVRIKRRNKGLKVR
jgi:hypothetical protein